MGIVLLTTDGSTFARDAMADAVALLGGDQSYVVLSVASTVAAPLAVGAMGPSPVTMPDPATAESVERAERAAAEEAVAETIAAIGVDADPIIGVGDPAAEICRQAGELAVDVVAVGSKGHGWLARLVLGSVSTYVVNHAPCPVLAMRQPHPPEPDDEG